MKDRAPEKKELTRREFLGKALFPAVGFGFLSIYLGRLFTDRRSEKGKKANISFKEASYYSKLAG